MLIYPIYLYQTNIYWAVTDRIYPWEQQNWFE